jgi:hypothetical protein
MRIVSALATVFAAIVVAGPPASASDAALQTEPIRISGAQLFSSRHSDDNRDYPGSLGVEFTNTKVAAAVKVVFVIESSGGAILDRIDDVGSFATGVRVSHIFRDTFDTLDQRVAVATATFADGTTWSNPNVSRAPEPLPVVSVKATLTF